MKKSQLMWSGIVAAVLLSSSAAFALNPAVLNYSSPNSGFLQATKSIFFVNGNLQASQPQSNAANATLQIGSPFFGRNTDNYFATAQVRCNGSAQIFVKSINGPSTLAQIVCNGVGNAWAGTIQIR